MFLSSRYEPNPNKGNGDLFIPSMLNPLTVLNRDLLQKGITFIAVLYLTLVSW